MKKQNTKSLMMNGLNKLSRTGFFHIFGSNTINQIVNFAYGILIVHIIPKARFGVFAYTNNIYAMLMLISGFGMSSAILQIASEATGNEDRRLSIFSYGYHVALRVNACLSIVLLVIAVFIPLNLAGSNVLLALMCLLPIGSVILELQKVWLRVTLQNKEFAQINTVHTLLISIGAIVGALFLWEKGIVAGQYLAAILTIGILLKWRKSPVFPQQGTLELQDKRDLFKIAGISTLNNGLGSLLPLLGTLILGATMPEENTIAAYKVALTIPGALDFVPISLMAYVYPYFAKNRNNFSWVRGRYKRLMLFAGTGNMLITCGGVVFAPFIIRIVFGAQYLDAVLPFRVLMIGYFVSGNFRIIAGNLLVTQRRLTYNLFIGIIGAAISLGGNALLIPQFGSFGAALSQLITVSITGVLLTGYFIYLIHSDKISGNI